MLRQCLSLEIDPLDCGIENHSDVPPFAPSPVSAFSYHAPFAHGPVLDTTNSSNNGWTPTSCSTSAISGSPAPLAHVFSYALDAGLLMQQLEMQNQEQPFDGWMQQGPMVEPAQQQYDLGGGSDFGVQLQLQQYAHVGGAAPPYSTIVQQSELQEYTPMGTHVDDYAPIQMGEPSGSGSGSQQGWYLNAEQLGDYEGQYAGGVYEGEFAEDVLGLGDGAQAHGY